MTRIPREVLDEKQHRGARDHTYRRNRKRWIRINSRLWASQGWLCNDGAWPLLGRAITRSSSMTCTDKDSCIVNAAIETQTVARIIEYLDEITDLLMCSLCCVERIEAPCDSLLPFTTLAM